MRVRLYGTIVSVALLGIPTSALAQPSSSSAWGISGVFVPKWTTPPWLGFVFGGDNTVDVSGSELRVGVVRGRSLSGDWGISFVSKTLSDDSIIVTDDGATFCSNGDCVTPRTVLQPRDARVVGGELHKYFNFGTIKGRVQVGLELAGGVGAVRGSAVKTTTAYQFAPSGTVPRWVETITQEDVPASELFAEGVEYIPLARFELGVGVILTRSLKVRVTGGFNSPGTQAVSVRAIYLFGGS